MKTRKIIIASVVALSWVIGWAGSLAVLNNGLPVVSFGLRAGASRSIPDLSGAAVSPLLGCTSTRVAPDLFWTSENCSGAFEAQVRFIERSQAGDGTFLAWDLRGSDLPDVFGQSMSTAGSSWTGGFIPVTGGW